MIKNSLDRHIHKNSSAILIMEGDGELDQLMQYILRKGYKVIELSRDNWEQRGLGFPEDFPPQADQTAHIVHNNTFSSKVHMHVARNLENLHFKIDDLANALCISRTVLYKKMKSTMGISPIDFVRKKRIERAVQLLETGEYTVTEVSYKCGFGSPQYLARVFKETIGYTPGKYKQRKDLR